MLSVWIKTVQHVKADLTRKPFVRPVSLHVQRTAPPHLASTPPCLNTTTSDLLLASVQLFVCASRRSDWTVYSL